MIGAAIAQPRSAQDYPGAFRVVLVDDSSTRRHRPRRRARPRSGATAGPARGPDRRAAAAPAGPASSGRSRRGSRAPRAQPPDYLLAHRRRHRPRARRPAPLVAARRGAAARAGLADGEAALRQPRRAAAGSGLRVLLPDALSVRLGERPGRTTAAAAGGCMLVRREALEAAGGIAAIRGEIIDDCALGARHEARRADLAGPDPPRAQPAPLRRRSARSAGWCRARPTPSSTIRRGCWPGRCSAWRSIYLRRAARGAVRRRRRPRWPASPPGRRWRRLPADAALLPPLAALGPGPAADRGALCGLHPAVGASTSGGAAAACGRAAPQAIARAA